MASDDEIKQLENFYRVYYGKDISFPQHYPSGCILGCVEVVDVLPQEEYRLQFPNGESESPYVFLCENPLELFIKFPNKGQHKICKFTLESWKNCFNKRRVVKQFEVGNCHPESDGIKSLQWLEMGICFPLCTIANVKVRYLAITVIGCVPPPMFWLILAPCLHLVKGLL